MHWHTYVPVAVMSSVYVVTNPKTEFAFRVTFVVMQTLASPAFSRTM